MTVVESIQAPTTSAAWCKLLETIVSKGEKMGTEYGGFTKRIHATVHITDATKGFENGFAPFGPQSLEQYRQEMTEEYADWYMSLKDTDKRKFEYCYAKQLFRYGEKAYNHLKRNIENLRPCSRRHVGVLWENEVHIERFEDQPCWIAYGIEYNEKGQVTLKILYRSWDAFGGFPANIPGIIFGVNKALREYAQIKSIPALHVTEVVATGWDLHIYDRDLPIVQDIIEKRKCTKCGAFTQVLAPGSSGFVCPDCMR